MAIAFPNGYPNNDPQGHLVKIADLILINSRISNGHSNSTQGIVASE
jgi:hypothetical protein